MVEQQGIVEPLEEVGYKNRPPLLEDVSIEGPTRTPIPHALDTLEQREEIEDDYNWWRYSKLALPWLLFMLLLFATLFTLTAYTQVGELHDLRDGVPTYFQLQYDSNKNDEANTPKSVRNLRIAAASMGVFAVATCFLVLYSKPRPVARKIFHYLLAFVLFATMVLSWIAFGIGEAKGRNSERCPEMRYFSNEKCVNREGVGTVASILDFLIAITCITAIPILCYTTFTGDFKFNRTGWREQERDGETEEPKREMVKPHKVRQTRVALTAFALIVVLLLCITQLVFVVVMHQDHDIINPRSERGRGNRTFDRYSTLPFEEPGWSIRNTRLRYSYSAIAILTILANLLPWRSRVIAYLFAFIYFCIFVLSIVCFAFDVHELRRARNDYGCFSPWLGPSPSDALYDPVFSLPNLKVNCINGPYVCAAIFDFFAACAILIYITFEYVIRYQSIHSGRKYPFFAIRKVEQDLDSRRPVRCEITNEVMTAAHYYYRHRFLSEPEMLAGVGMNDATSTSSGSVGVPNYPYDPAYKPPPMM